MFGRMTYQKMLQLACMTKRNISQQPKATLLEEYIQFSRYPSIAEPHTDLFSLVTSDIDLWRNQTCMECAVTGRSYTYSQMMNGSLKWASVLNAMVPAKENPVVAPIMSNCPEFAPVILGTLAKGAVISPINFSYHIDEICRQVCHSDADILVIDAMIEDLARDVCIKLKRDISIVVNGKSRYGNPNIQEILTSDDIPTFSVNKVDPESVALMPYSSGTTGIPKGVMTQHSHIATCVQNLLSDNFFPLEKANGNFQESTIGVLPYFHIYGILLMMANLARGSKIITLPVFDPSSFSKVLKNNKISTLNVVTPLLKFMNESPQINKQDLAHLHAITLSSAPIPLPLAQDIRKKIASSCSIQEGYGMTEVLATHMTPRNGEKLGSCGQLLPGFSALVLDSETGRPLAADTDGELYVKGPTTMKGYFKNVKATEQMIDANGWVQTGDIVSYDNDGYFSFVDRIKDIIKVKGFQVSPTEIEEVLIEHDAIADIGVVGVSHARLGEAPRAYIVKGKSSLTEEQVENFMKENMCRQKQLEGGIVFVKELPRSKAGKILRKDLTQM